MSGLFSSGPCRRMIRDTRHAAFDSAAGATEHHTLVALCSVAHNPAAAMVADRSHGVNGAFKAIEYVGAPRHRYFKGLVVVIAADFTYRHWIRPSFP